MHRHIAFVLALTLAACGGGGNATLPAAPSATSQPSGPLQNVKIALVIPVASASTTSKRASFVSASASGVSISVHGSQGATTTAVADISTGSNACSTSAGQRTCTIVASAPFGTDTFTISLYDMAPVGSSIPSSAHLLSVGSVTQTISNTFTGSLSIFVGGQISNIGLSSTYASAAANGTAQSIGITITPKDFGNTTIVAGSNDPYANPISVALSETGGSGHMHLVLNGTASGTSATLTKSSDTIAIAYDGGGSAGYTAGVSLSATGAATQTLTVSPMFVSSTSPLFASGTLSLSGTASNISLVVQEANAPSGLTYTVSANGCTNIATNTAISGTAASSTFSVAGGTTASASGCTIAIGDGITTNIIHVVNSPNGATLPLPGSTITEYVLVNPPATPASPDVMVPGPDGRVWYTDVLTGGYGAITTAGVSTFHQTGITGYGGLVAGPDGNMWATDAGPTDYIFKIDPSTMSVLKSYAIAQHGRSITVGPDGNLWFGEDSGFGSPLIGTITPFGGLTEYSINPVVGASPQPRGMIKAPNGSVWFCDNYNSRIDSVDVNGSFTMAVDLTMAPVLGSGCNGLTVGPDNKVWVSGNSAGVVQVDPFTNGVLAVIPLSSTMDTNSWIAAGADYAVYASEGNKLARISTLTGHALTEYTAPGSPPTIRGVALGTDGRMWFSENGINKAGALTP